MATSLFTVDGVAYPHLRVLELTQTFDIIDGPNSGRVLTGEMRRDVIGTYFNYKLKLKPEYTREGMQDYNKFWYVCSNPTEYHTLVVPFDVDASGNYHTTLTFRAYITSGSRDMLKYNVDGVDYWKEGDFQFVAMEPERTPI